MSNIWSRLINLAGNITGVLATANGGTGSATIGTANQVLGVNSGATALEYKTITTGTAGSDFAVAQTANTVTLNLPDASASNRGAVTTGTQTMAGAKTFSTSIALASSGGTATALNYFEEGTQSATFTQSGGYSQTVTLRFTRLGTRVWVSIPGFQASATALAKISAATVLPSKLQPAHVYNSLLMVINAATSVASGLIVINTNGTIDLYSSVAQGNFTSGANAGVYFNGATDFQTFSYDLN